MESETSNDSEHGYFTVHHRKNGRDKEAYFAYPKTTYNRTSYKNGSKCKSGAGFQRMI